MQIIIDNTINGVVNSDWVSMLPTLFVMRRGVNLMIRVTKWEHNTGQDVQAVLMIAILKLIC